ncbi:MAG: TetR/AcrR family transcriptional regulator [Anaerolineae bacterium]|nr:TetR/AcrR family transcriptional regulator [Anaerolineae bacterium]
MTDPIQQQLITARKNQILDAAARVFATKGFHAATIKDVASDAGIAAGTIYNYFENKTALLFAIFERMRDSRQALTTFAELQPDDVRGFIRAFVATPLMSLHSDYLDLFRVVISEIMVNEELRALYAQQIIGPTLIIAEKWFQTWIAQGLIKPIDTGLMVRTLSSLILGLMVQKLIGDELLQTRWESLPDTLTDLIMDGIRGET